MDRLARHHATAGLIAALVAAAGCTGDDAAGCPDVPATFALTAPGGAIELVPGAGLHLTWTPADASVDDATVGFALIAGDTRVVLPDVAVAAGGLDVTETAADTPVPTGVYRIEGRFGGCAATPTRYDAGPLRLVYAQGLRFAATQLTFTGSQTARPIDVTTVSLSTFDLELLVDPTPDGPDGDELIVARSTVPGELVAMGRSLPFTGMTVGGAAVPDGAYQVRARIHARGGTLTYDVPGPGLTWAAGS